jgi:hypothetical protein
MYTVFRSKNQKPEGKRLLEKHRLRLEDNIKMDRRVIGWEGVDCMHVA